jgi:hypothetical protein
MEKGDQKMNHVSIEGTVTRHIWTYGGDTLFRLATEEGHYHTVRIRNMPVQPKPGTSAVIVGKLISREENVGLEDFVRRAEGGEKGDGELDDKQIKQLAKKVGQAHRTYTEILADEFLALA